MDGAGDLGVDLFADGTAFDAACLAGRVALDGGNDAALVQDDGLAVRLDVGRCILCFREFTDDVVGNRGRAGADGRLANVGAEADAIEARGLGCLLYTSPSPRD